MFGFLNPRPHTPAYRQAYARLCQNQRANFGVRSLPFHSYEAVFLYQVALDLGAFPASVMPAVKCCRLSKPANLHRESDAAVGRFCAGVGVLLASIKLEDDVRDAKGVLTRLSRRAASWALNRKILAARRLFTSLDGRFDANVRRLIADHHLLEQPGRTMSIGEYAEPTAHAFGYVFSRLSRLDQLSRHESFLMAIGRHVGAALIAFDCATDWHRDRRRGEFNPLADEEAVEESLVYSLSQLRDAETLLRETVHQRSQAADTLSRVQGRLLRFNPLATPGKCRVPAPVSRRVMLLVLSGGGDAPPEGTIPLEPNNTQGDQPAGGMPPGLPGGEKTVRKKKQGSDCCSNPACNDCCEVCYCGALSTDCCSALGAEACCGILECADCSC